MTYFVVIKEYADGELKKLGRYEGKWDNKTLDVVARKHRLFRGKWWVVEVRNGSAWVLGYMGRVFDVNEFLYLYSDAEIRRLARMLEMAGVNADGDNSK